MMGINPLSFVTYLNIKSTIIRRISSKMSSPDDETAKRWATFKARVCLDVCTSEHLQVELQLTASSLGNQRRNFRCFQYCQQNYNLGSSNSCFQAHESSSYSNQTESSILSREFHLLLHFTTVSDRGIETAGDSLGSVSYHDYTLLSTYNLHQSKPRYVGSLR